MDQDVYWKDIVKDKFSSISKRSSIKNAKHLKDNKFNDVDKNRSRKVTRSIRSTDIKKNNEITTTNLKVMKRSDKLNNQIYNNLSIKSEDNTNTGVSANLKLNKVFTKVIGKSNIIPDNNLKIQNSDKNLDNRNNLACGDTTINNLELKSLLKKTAGKTINSFDGKQIGKVFKESCSTFLLQGNLSKSQETKDNYGKKQQETSPSNISLLSQSRSNESSKLTLNETSQAYVNASLHSKTNVPNNARPKSTMNASLKSTINASLKSTVIALRKSAINVPDTAAINTPSKSAINAPHKTTVNVPFQSTLNASPQHTTNTNLNNFSCTSLRSLPSYSNPRLPPATLQRAAKPSSGKSSKIFKSNLCSMRSTSAILDSNKEKIQKAIKIDSITNKAISNRNIPNKKLASDTSQLKAITSRQLRTNRINSTKTKKG